MTTAAISLICMPRRLTSRLAPFATRSPQHVARLAVGVAGQDEQQVAEAVEVGDRQDVHAVGVLRVSAPAGPLRTAYDGPRHVQQRGARPPPGRMNDRNLGRSSL